MVKKKIYIFIWSKKHHLALGGWGRGLYGLQMWRCWSVNAGMTVHFELEDKYINVWN